MSYSTDFREKVLSFIEFGGKIKEACQIFSISHCSINRWKNTKKATGTVGRKPRPNSSMAKQRNTLSLADHECSAVLSFFPRLDCLGKV